jgi:hypothetical protein
VLTLSETPWLITTLRWLYRWPLFIPFIVAAQCMRTFLAKNGLMNNTLSRPASSTRSRRRACSTGAASSSPSSGSRCALRDLDARRRHGLARPGDDRGRRNLGASRLRVLVEIVLPQVGQTLLVASSCPS